MDLNEVNAVSLLEAKPITRIAELQLNTPHPIYGAEIINTKFGETILLELKDSKTFLPNRMLPLLKNKLEDFRGGKYSLVFKGLKEVNKPSKGVQFEFIESK